MLSLFHIFQVVSDIDRFRGASDCHHAVAICRDTMPVGDKKEGMPLQINGEVTDKPAFRFVIQRGAQLVK
jgi:hypothetical protein